MTFDNNIMRCFMLIAAVCVLAAFIDITKAECDFGCNFLVGPICAEDAKGNKVQFKDECELRLKMCKNPSRGYKSPVEGPCDKKEDDKKQDKEVDSKEKS